MNSDLGFGKMATGVQGFRIKNSNSKSSEKGKTRQITALLGMSASGIYCPPMFCYPGKDLPEGMTQASGGPRSCFLESSPTGGIKADHFLAWLQGHFLPFHHKQGRPLPSPCIRRWTRPHTFLRK